MSIRVSQAVHPASARFFDLDHAAAIVEIRRLVSAGLPERQIAGRIGWHIADVYRALGDLE